MEVRTSCEVHTVLYGWVFICSSGKWLQQEVIQEQAWFCPNVQQVPVNLSFPTLIAR